jgi:hypothetical protein
MLNVRNREANQSLPGPQPVLQLREIAALKQTSRAATPVWLPPAGLLAGGRELKLHAAVLRPAFRGGV